MKSSIPYILSMVIFGTIGIVVREIHLPSAERALLSSFVGFLFLLFIFKAMKKKFHWQQIKKNSLMIVAASVALAGNWIFLYSSYDFTTIAKATLAYYFAPIFMMALTPLLFKEKLQRKNILCIAVALAGLCCIIAKDLTALHGNDMVGIGFGLTAALFYTAMLLLNKSMTDVPPIENTIMQLGLTAILLFIYVFSTEGTDMFVIPVHEIPYILILGVLNVGIGFWLFYAGMAWLNRQKVAILSYVDPLVAIIISVILIHEPMTMLQYAGSFMLLAATAASQVKWRKRKQYIPI